MSYLILPYHLFTYVTICFPPKIWAELVWHLTDLINDVCCWSIHKRGLPSSVLSTLPGSYFWQFGVVNENKREVRELSEFVKRWLNGYTQLPTYSFSIMNSTVLYNMKFTSAFSSKFVLSGWKFFSCTKLDDHYQICLQIIDIPETCKRCLLLIWCGFCWCEFID